MFVQESPTLGVERQEVVVGLAVVVREATGNQQLRGLGRHLPPRGDVTSWPPPAHLLDEADAVLQDLAFLGRGHVDRVLVRVPVRPDLMTTVHDHPYLVGERLQGVPGDEPATPDPARSRNVSRRGTPTSPANMPRWMSEGEFWPP